MKTLGRRKGGRVVYKGGRVVYKGGRVIHKGGRVIYLGQAEVALAALRRAQLVALVTFVVGRLLQGGLLAEQAGEAELGLVLQGRV